MLQLLNDGLARQGNFALQQGPVRRRFRPLWKPAAAARNDEGAAVFAGQNLPDFLRGMTAKRVVPSASR